MKWVESGEEMREEEILVATGSEVVVSYDQAVGSTFINDGYIGRGLVKFLQELCVAITLPY